MDFRSIPMITLNAEVDAVSCLSIISAHRPETNHVHDEYIMSNPHYKYSLDTALSVRTTLSGYARVRSREERGRSHLTGSGVIL